MKCPKCGKEVFLDHVVKKEDRTDYFYVCMNARCQNYRKAFKPTGEEAESKIIPKK